MVVSLTHSWIASLNFAMPLKLGRVFTRATWINIGAYSVFLPFLWPSKSRRLQVHALLCFLVIVAQRVMNLMVPIQMGHITNTLTRNTSAGMSISWNVILTYVVYRWLQGGQSLLSSLRSRLWTPVGHHIHKELSAAGFEHLLHLGWEFHLRDTKNEISPALGESDWIIALLDQVVFQCGPIVVDIIFALGYFWAEFDTYYAFVAGSLAGGYIIFAIRLLKGREVLRRQYIDAKNKLSRIR